MSDILAVFGATGQQGSSVVNFVLNDAELSKRYKIRAITRDINSEKAKQLQTNVEVVQADVSDRASLENALAGVHTIFAMSTPSFGPDAFEIEYNNCKTIADVAVAQHAQYLIFSTLPSVKKISGSKLTNVVPFDVKAEAAEYIRTLPIKSAFYCPGSFMENFQSQTFLAPKKSSDGTWIMSRHTSPKTRLPLIDAVGDGGKFVGAILAEPDKYEGKTFCAATTTYSMEEVCAIMSKVTGQTVVYKQIPVDEFRDSMPFAQDMWVDVYSYYDEFGYFGPDTENLVTWAASNARGRLSTLEEFLVAQPFKLS